jgi:hypothetical protein
MNVPSETERLHVSYLASHGGSISGRESQTVNEGENAEIVTAVADAGYIFAYWSDGNTNAARQDKDITDTINVTAIFERLVFTVQYSAGTGGNISGQASQTVEYGGNAISVTAVADAGCEFIEWSDGNTNAERQDKDITGTINVTAIFERLTKTFNYIYNNATGNNAQKSITLQRGELRDAVFSIPEKEHFVFNGWYLDANFSICIADEAGCLLIGDEIFNDDSSDIYAKWTVVEKIIHKILMVFVTEVNATLTTTDGTSINVNYKMTELEKKVCEAIAIQFAAYINKMLDGLVIFEVDIYFTTVALKNENIYNGDFGPGDNISIAYYCISAEDIPEVSGMLDDYRNVITTFCFNDYDGLLHNAAGYGNEKYAMVHFENVVMQTLFNGDPLESLLNLTYKEWDHIMDTYTHEFTHSIEQGLAVYQFHRALAAYSNQGIWGLEPIRLYLLHQAIADGEKVGIPYAFWKDEIFTVTYNAAYGGYIESDWFNGWLGYREQRVPKGSRANTVTALTINNGYRFVGWSDGETSATRTDIDIQSDLNLTAYFECASFEVNYLAGEGGRIIGETTQSVLFRERSKTVTAVADMGYRFVEWSDGKVQAERYDLIVLDSSGKVSGLSVTAIFEKI